MQFQHEPRQQDFATPTGYRIAKANYDKAVQNKIIEALVEADLSSGKVIEGFFRKPRARKTPKPGKPIFPHREDFETEEEYKAAKRVYAAKISNAAYYRKKEKLGIVSKKNRTGIKLKTPSRKDYVSEEAFADAMKAYKREYNRQYMEKKERGDFVKKITPTPLFRPIQELIGESIVWKQPPAIEMAKTYLSQKMNSDKLQALIDNFIIQLALKEALKESENILLSLVDNTKL
jgi:hypothetical protein